MSIFYCFKTWRGTGQNHRFSAPCVIRTYIGWSHWIVILHEFFGVRKLEALYGRPLGVDCMMINAFNRRFDTMPASKCSFTADTLRCGVARRRTTPQRRQTERHDHLIACRSGGGSQKWGGMEQRGPKSRSSTPEGPWRGEVFGQRTASFPPTSYKVRESDVSSPNGVRGKAPAEIDFCVLIPQKASSTTIWGSNSIWRQKSLGPWILRRHEPPCLIGSTAYDSMYRVISRYASALYMSRVMKISL